MIIEGPTFGVVLLVPKGFEHLPVKNPMGPPDPYEAEAANGGPDWSRIEAPTLVTIDVDRLPSLKGRMSSKLRVVP